MNAGYVGFKWAEKFDEKEKLGAYAMKRVAAGAHLELRATLWLFEPAKGSDDRADFCLGLIRVCEFYYRVWIFDFDLTEMKNF